MEGLVLRLLETAPELGSLARIAPDVQRQHWPVRYHLAAERANLLRHFDFAGLDVLELGAGLGGVSRFLAEEARSLTVVEGSAARFASLAARLRDLDNWSGDVCRIEDFPTDKAFDVVCAIGVLEYAERYLEKPADVALDAFDFLLQRAAGWVKPGGVLLVAIENRLGLKYWSGAGEDHSGHLFDGVVGYPATPVARTFSRRELRQRLERAGFEDIAEYFPAPDYKLPQSVLTTALIECDPALATDLACYREFLDYVRLRSHLFPDYLALDNLARAGLFADFANSFLFAASRPGEPQVFSRLTRAGAGGPREVAWHYSPQRRLPTLTVFTCAPGDTVIEVEKRPLTAAHRPATWATGAPTAHVVESQGLAIRWQPAARAPVALGERLRHRLLRRMYFREEEAFRVELERFLGWVLARFAGPSPDLLRGEAVDALFRNAVVAGDGYELIDQEWDLVGEPTLPTTWFVLRNVLALDADRSAFNLGLGFASLAELYARLCQRLDLHPDLERDLQLEAGFQEAVSGAPLEPTAANLRLVLEQPFQHRHLPPREPDFLLRWVHTIQQIEEHGENFRKAVLSQQSVIANQTDLISHLHQMLAAEQETVRQQQQTLTAQQQTLAVQQESLAAAFRDLRASRERAGTAAAVAAARELRTGDRRGEQTDREPPLQSRGELLYREGLALRQLQATRRHRLVEDAYQWTARRRSVFAVVKAVWRALLWLAGKRPAPVPKPAPSQRM